ncbi:MAG: hypothetical protein PHY43_11360 [Verrucomicrobiales bacterium]|nr:hypothetical protein [Verrucomicrobiales bacterium]
MNNIALKDFLTFLKTCSQTPRIVDYRRRNSSGRHSERLILVLLMMVMGVYCASAAIPGTVLECTRDSNGGAPQYNHAIYLPANYDAEDATNRHPLYIMFGGYTGVEMTAHQIRSMWSIMTRVEGGKLPALVDAGCIVVCAELLINGGKTNQNPGDIVTGSDWPNIRTKKIHLFVNELKTKYRVDRSRIYITGHSWGAAGAAAYVQDYGDADSIAAVGPNECGWSKSGGYSNYVHMATWFYEGYYDSVTKPGYTISLMNRIADAMSGKTGSDLMANCPYVLRFNERGSVTNIVDRDGAGVVAPKTLTALYMTGSGWMWTEGTNYNATNRLKYTLFPTDRKKNHVQSSVLDDDFYSKWLLKQRRF